MEKKQCVWRKAWGILLSCLLLLTLLPLAAAAEDGAVSFTVRVTNQEDEPLEGAAFLLTGIRDSEGSEYTSELSNAEGIASLSAPDGLYTLTQCGASEGYLPSDESHMIQIMDKTVYLYVESQPYSGTSTPYEQLTFRNDQEPSVVVTLPVVVRTEQTGEKAPGKETFRILVETLPEPDITVYGEEENRGPNMTVLENTVHTDGVGEFRGEMRFSVLQSQLVKLTDGFLVKMEQGDADGWTYSDTVYRARLELGETDADAFTVRAVYFYEQKEEAEEEDELSEALFVCSYNKVADPEKPLEPETPETGDSGLVLTGVILLAAAVAAAVLVHSRKRKTV